MKILKIKQKTTVILLLILGIGLFLRAYNILGTFGFGHDADLFSWIVKDILVNHHLRLIGQETSTPGIFIGALFYYLLTPFYFITGMHPTSSILLVLIIGVVTIFSYYLVFKNLFDEITGLTAAFLQAVIPFRIDIDRWIVPTVTVNLWCVWFFFAIFKISRRSLNYLILAGFLSGLIWHVHIALAPLLILIPLSVIFSGKFPSLKQIGLFLGAFLIPMLPFFVFEIKHGFIQTISFFSSFSIVPENLAGIYGSSKLDDVIRESFGSNYYLNFVLLGLFLLLPKLKVLTYKMVVLIFVWVGSILAFFTISKKLISEYYFENIKTVLLVSMILYLALLIKSKNKLLRLPAYGILGLLLIFSLYHVYNLPTLGNGYIARMKVVDYIKNDSAAKNFPCISVTHISSPGEDFGYRYLYWYNKIKMAKPGEGIPDYTIVYPYSLATESARFRYGAINVIPPEKEYNLQDVAATCPAVDYNLTDPFWGFTN